MKARLYLVRHAEAEGNLYRRIHGQYDSLVTPNGLRQIEALRERFRGERIDACYASDLVRTRTTARAVCAPRHMPLRLEPGLREVRLGVWEDVPFGRLDLEEPEQMYNFNNDPDAWHVEGAEDFQTYSARFLNAVESIARRGAGKTVALFSHGSVIRSMQRRLFAGAELPGYCDNTAVSLLEYEDGRFHAVYLNDNSHLPPEISTLARQNWWRGGKDYNLWFRPERDRDWYLACRDECWRALYGEPLPDPGSYYRAALDGAGDEPEALCAVMLGRERIGVVQLDTRHSGGHVGFFYLCPEYRGQGLGVQLLGQAVSVFRRLGRTELSLLVSPRNRAADAFYRRCGFRETGRVPGAHGELIRLALDIRLNRDLAGELAEAAVQR